MEEVNGESGYGDHKKQGGEGMCRKGSVQEAMDECMQKWQKMGTPTLRIIAERLSLGSQE